jgi:hypothetical protein
MRRRRCRPARAGAESDAPAHERAASRPWEAALSLRLLLLPSSYFFFAPRLSRTRTEIWIGVPSKPNSSRSRRSMKRR